MKKFQFVVAVAVGVGVAEAIRVAYSLASDALMKKIASSR